MRMTGPSEPDCCCCNCKGCCNGCCNGCNCKGCKAGGNPMPNKYPK